jgi:hypothetical protein
MREGWVRSARVRPISLERDFGCFTQETFDADYKEGWGLV